MPNSSPLASTQPSEAAASINRVQSRLAICLVLTVLNAIVVANFAGPLYRATTHDALQQIGVTLLFAALVGSLTRMAEQWIENQGHRILDRMTWHEPLDSWSL